MIHLSKCLSSKWQQWAASNVEQWAGSRSHALIMSKGRPHPAPSVHPGVHPAVPGSRPHYEDLTRNFPAASPDLQMAPVFAFLQYGANIWTDKQSRCESELRNICRERNNSGPAGLWPCGCGPFTRAKSNRWRGFSIHTELLLLPTFTPGLKVGHGVKVLVSPNKRKVWGNHNSEQI